MYVHMGECIYGHKGLLVEHLPSMCKDMGSISAPNRKRIGKNALNVRMKGHSKEQYKGHSVLTSMHTQ